MLVFRLVEQLLQRFYYISRILMISNAHLVIAGLGMGQKRSDLTLGCWRRDRPRLWPPAREIDPFLLVSDAKLYQVSSYMVNECK